MTVGTSSIQSVGHSFYANLNTADQQRARKRFTSNQKQKHFFLQDADGNGWMVAVDGKGQAKTEETSPGTAYIAMPLTR